MFVSLMILGAILSLHGGDCGASIYVVTAAITMGYPILLPNVRAVIITSSNSTVLQGISMIFKSKIVIRVNGSYVM